MFHNLRSDNISCRFTKRPERRASLKMPLVAAGELSDDTLLTIEITVANDVNIGEAIESDIIYGVPVETNLIGIKTYDSS